MTGPDEAQPARRGITLRQVAPNAVTAMALCFGLTGIRFAVAGEWEKAVAAIVFAGVLDGLDGRIARLVKGESRFGAELDSLSDVIAFGVAPALVIYLWSLQYLPKFGWTDRGYEYPLFWGLVMFAIALRGGGPYSVDRVIGREL